MPSTPTPVPGSEHEAISSVRRPNRLNRAAHPAGRRIDVGDRRDGWQLPGIPAGFVFASEVDVFYKLLAFLKMTWHQDYGVCSAGGLAGGHARWVSRFGPVGEICWEANFWGRRFWDRYWQLL